MFWYYVACDPGVYLYRDLPIFRVQSYLIFYGNLFNTCHFTANCIYIYIIGFVSSFTWLSALFPKVI